MPIDVPEELELLVDKAADRIKLAVREATYLKTFVVSGFDIKSIGEMSIFLHEILTFFQCLNI